MQKRAGKTVKVSVSLDKADLAALRRLARASFGGNLSAAFADAARWLRQQEARRSLVDLLGGPILTPAAAAVIEAEQAGPPPRKARKRSAA
jgi:hypothetical protein